MGGFKSEVQQVTSIIPGRSLPADAVDPQAFDRLLVELFIEAHDEAPREIWLDLDATDDPLHGHQEGRFFPISAITMYSGLP